MGEWKISGRMENIWFSLVCLVGGGGKVGGWKTFLFGWREKWEDGKCSLYKLIIIFLLYNSGKVRGVGECNRVGVFV